MHAHRPAIVAIFSISALLATSSPTSAAPSPKFPSSKLPKVRKPSVKPIKLDTTGVKLPGRIDRANLGRLGEDSMLGKALKAETPRSKGSLAASSLGSRTVEVAPGKTATLASISGQWFAEHDRLKTDIRDAKSSVFGAIQDEVEVYEMANAYIMVRTTGATVSNPDQLRQKSPVFASFTKNRTKKVQMSALSSTSKKGLAAFKKELEKRPSGDPLRIEMKKGDQALLNALADGVGEMSVIDTLIIPKKMPELGPDNRMRAPSVIDGRFDYGTMKTLDTGRVHAASLSEDLGVTDAGREKLQKALKLDRRGHVVSGSTGSTSEFITGYTWADSWGWERTFNVPSGFLRVKLGAHYALGLRVPVEVKTRMSPTYVCENGQKHEQEQHRFKLEAKATAVDGDRAFYERAGMPEEMIADGKELALEAGVGYGVKLRLFWETLVDKPYREKGFDWGRDFDPPQGSGTTQVVDYFLPSSVTKSKLNFGPLHGSARIGFRVDVQGEAKAHVTGFQGDDLRQAVTRPAGSTAVSGGNPSNSPQKMVFRDTGWKTWEFLLLNKPRSPSNSTPSYSEKFGYMIDKVEYDSTWSVVPGVKVKAEASYAGYGIGGTWKFWLDSARLPIGSLDLPRHRRTRNAVRSDRGTKTWHVNGIGDTDFCNRV